MDQLLNLTLNSGTGSWMWKLLSTFALALGSASRLFLSADAQKAGPISAVMLQLRASPKAAADEMRVDISLPSDACSHGNKNCWMMKILPY